MAANYPTIEEVCDALTEREVEMNVVDNFRINKVDGHTIVALSNQDFQNLGLVALGDIIFIKSFCSRTNKSSEKEATKNRRGNLLKALRNLQKQTHDDNEDKAQKRPGRPFSDMKSVHVGLRITSKNQKFLQIKSPLGDKNILSMKFKKSATFKQLLDQLIETFFPDNLNPVIGHCGKYVFDIVNTLNVSIDETDFTLQNYTSKKLVAGQLRLHLLCSMATSNSQHMMNTQPEPSFAAYPAAQSMATSNSQRMMNTQPEPSSAANPAAQSMATSNSQRMMNTQPVPSSAANPAAQSMATSNSQHMMNTQPVPSSAANPAAQSMATSNSQHMMNTQPVPSSAANPAAQSMATSNSQRMMNTQPEPSSAANPTAQSMATSNSQRMMNTQPEPCFAAYPAAQSMATSNSQRMMNTQPEPSFAANPTAQSMATSNSQRMMNIQPEPCFAAYLAAQSMATSNSQRMMNTQPEPSFAANPTAQSMATSNSQRMMNTQPEPSFAANPTAQSMATGNSQRMMNTQPVPSFAANPTAQSMATSNSQRMMNTQPEPNFAAYPALITQSGVSVSDVILTSSDESVQFIDLTVSGEVAARLSSTPRHVDEHNAALDITQEPESASLESVDETPLHDHNSLKDIMECLEKNIDNDLPPNLINVSRFNLWKQGQKAFRKDTFVDAARLSVRFVGEVGVDNGGLSREFMSMAISHISQLPIFGEDGCHGCKYIKLDYAALEKEQYFTTGKMLSYFLCHRGPAPVLFSSKLYESLVDSHKSLNIEDVQDEEIKTKIMKIVYAQEESYYETIDELQDFIDAAGCTNLAITWSRRPVLVKSLIQFYVRVRVAPAIEQLRDGLRTLNVLDEMERHPTLMKPLFVPGQDVVTAETILALYECEWSAEDTNRRRKEELTYVQFMDFVDSLEKENKIEAFLAWLTGMPRLPQLGFKEKAKITFDHPEDLTGTEAMRKGLPFVNTCALVLRLPVMDDEERFMANMKNSIAFRFFTAS